MMDLFVLLQQVHVASLKDDLEDLSPWERGEMRRIMELIARELDTLSSSTYNNDGTFTLHEPKAADQD